MNGLFSVARFIQKPLTISKLPLTKSLLSKRRLLEFVAAILLILLKLQAAKCFLNSDVVFLGVFKYLLWELWNLYTCIWFFCQLKLAATPALDRIPDWTLYFSLLASEAGRRASGSSAWQLCSFRRSFRRTQTAHPYCPFGAWTDSRSRVFVIAFSRRSFSPWYRYTFDDSHFTPFSPYARFAKPEIFSQ